MRLAYHVMSSPLGLLFLARSERGLRHLDFMDRKSLKRMIKDRSAGPDELEWVPSLMDVQDIVQQLDEYLCGLRKKFETELDLVGTEFQASVWRALLGIPYGETSTYGAVAKTIGQPRSARAVGLANNQNPVAIVVPCHRVIGANGKLTGYGGGIERKKWLLKHEERFVSQEPSERELLAAADNRVSSRRTR
jgi:methylated-DNA-[protein]-cysteine S-methyltransferase